MSGTGRDFTMDLDVTVEVNRDVLEENGWHHEDECGRWADDEAPPDALDYGERRQMVEAIESLHRQAHPSQSTETIACREEPCRSLSIDWKLSPMSTHSTSPGHG